MAEKNLRISDDLLAEIEAMALARGETADALVEQVLREKLDFEKALSAGHAHAKERGFKPSDVSKRIDEYRREKHSRDR
jgi:hypothetical protein